ncbi:MAG: ABC transporter substrate-binding protein, partial [Fibrobacterota bacterium]
MKKSILLIWCILSATTAQPIKRIVSLSPAIDYHLMALEADSLIVGATVYSPLEEAARIGDVLTVNIESLVALRPDIVLTTPITPAGKLAMIRKLNIPLRVIDKPRSYSDLCRQFREVARAAGYKKQADSLITVYNTKVHAVRDKNRSRDRIP